MSTPAAPAAEAAPAAPVADVTPDAPAPESPAATGAPADPGPVVTASTATAGAPAGTETAPEGTPAAPAPEVPAGVDGTGTTDIVAGGAEAGAEGADATEVDQLPSWAQKHIRDLREENKRSRLETKQAAVEDATKAARDALAQDLGRALGILPPEGEEGGEGGEDAPEPLTAEQLTDMLAAERVSTQNAKIELAVFRASGAHSADPGALLDSRSFLDAVKNVDPSDHDSLNAAIREAVAANPRLKLAEPTPAVDPEPEPTPPPSGGTFAGGPSGRGNDVSTMSIDDFRKQYKEQRPR